MAIQVQTVGATDLRLAASIIKPNYSLGRTIGGATGKVMGHWRAFMVRFPSSGFSNNVQYLMLGASATDAFTSGNDTSLRVGGDVSSQGVNRLRPITRYRGTNVDAFGGSLGAEGALTSIAQMPVAPAAVLIIEGVRNVGTDAAPVWKGWGAACPIGSGTPSSHVAATDIASGWITNTAGNLMRQVFAAQGTSTARTAVGVTIEHVALAAGDFPWDTANNRPHHDAVAALAGVGSNPFLTYATLVAAQNAGTLPYANCDQGLGNLDYWWTLSGLTTGLTNSGTAGAATLSQTDWNSLTGGLIDAASIAPSHWGPTMLQVLGLSSTSVVQGAATTINITNATAGSTIALQSGSLPAGMTLNGGARTIAGTPTASGAASFVLRETLAGASNTPQDTGLSIAVSAVPTLNALGLSSTVGVQGSPVTINITGATAGSTLTVQSGSLPAGLTLNSAARTITGTPSATGASSFTLRETLAGATNTPNDTALSMTISASVPAPTITNPVVKFNGGRGARALVATGTGDSSQSVQRRWERMDTSEALPGFDWATAPVQSGGAWSISDVLPVGGPYRLRVRYAGATSLAASSDDWLVGSVILTHGQSGMERAFMQGGGPPGTNVLGVPVAAGAQGLLLKLNNQEGGTAAAYVQPVQVQVRMRSGETPVLGHGAVLFLNEWNVHNPGHPVLICNMAINGTAMSEWASNSTINGGHASWTFLGTLNAVAGASSGNGSGVVETYAALLGRYVDLHMMMWTPGMSSDASVRTSYIAAIDARFTASASAPYVVLPPWRGHRNSNDSSATVIKRREHLDFVAQLAARGNLGPYWPDIVSDASSSLHSAFNSATGVPSPSLPVSDGNRVGQGRLGMGLGRVAAWHFDRTIKANGPRVVAAWFTDNTRASIQIELGRKVRTLGGAAISNQFWISTDNGVTFVNTGFTVALSADGTRAVLTSTGAAFPASNVRVDYVRLWPFSPSENADEGATERLLDGLLYDDQTHRGGSNFTAGVRPGNPLQGTNRTGAGSAGVLVQARGAAKLMTTERWTGTRNVVVRLMAADGVTILRQKTLAITAS